MYFPKPQSEQNDQGNPYFHTTTPIAMPCS
jgi:hypothetical protein